jgi:hypothetical protein
VKNFGNKGDIMKLLILLMMTANICLAANDHLRSTADSGTLSLGLNPTTREPLIGSDWIVQFSNVDVGNCDALAATDFIFNDGSTLDLLNVFLDPGTPDCSTASHEDDPTDQIIWNDLGLFQDISFGTETLNCGAQASNCGINQDVTFEDQVFSSVVPTQGVNGTGSAKANIFTYNIGALSTSNVNGEGGAGGLNNLPSYPIVERYCLLLKDFASEGASSEFAKEPNLEMYVYQWKPIISSPSAAPGITPSVNGKDITVFKHIDSSMRYWLTRDNVVNVGQ